MLPDNNTAKTAEPTSEYYNRIIEAYIESLELVGYEAEVARQAFIVGFVAGRNLPVEPESITVEGLKGIGFTCNNYEKHLIEFLKGVIRVSFILNDQNYKVDVWIDAQGIGEVTAKGCTTLQDIKELDRLING